MWTQRLVGWLVGWLAIPIEMHCAPRSLRRRWNEGRFYSPFLTTEKENYFDGQEEVSVRSRSLPGS